MSSSEEASSLFVTQSSYTFQENESSDNLLNTYLDTSSSSDEGNEVTRAMGHSEQHLQTETKTQSDDEVLASCVVAEINLPVVKFGEDSEVKTKRFHEPLTDEQVEEMQKKKKFATSTQAKIRWAITLFRKWQVNRNALVTGGSRPLSLILVPLEEMSIDEINYSVSCFICEVKKSDGTDFPSDTLHGLVIMLQMYLETLNKTYKLLSEECFSQIKNTLDNAMKKRARQGNPPKKQAEIITLEEEEAMWKGGILGSENPKALVATLLYQVGLNFALRGGEEHRNLRRGSTSQLKIGQNQLGRFLSYTEDVSKANQGGLKHRKCKVKAIVAYENVTKPERCVVRLYEKYLSHCPPDTDNTAFYLRPLQKPQEELWYSKQSIGRHKLAATVADLCNAAGLSGYRSSHSLRASAASRMYDAGVDEQLICEVTGHRSNAVREYKRTSVGQKRKMSSVIQGAATSTSQVKRSTEDSTISVTVNLNLGK